MKKEREESLGKKKKGGSATYVEGCRNSTGLGTDRKGIYKTRGHMIQEREDTRMRGGLLPFGAQISRRPKGDKNELDERKNQPREKGTELK